MSSVKSRTFHWQFDHPVEQVWPLLTDTARLNEVSGFPKHQIEEIEQADGSMLFQATAEVGPMTIRWDDRSQNWVTNRWLRHDRFFTNGPLKFLKAYFVVEPDGEGSTLDLTIEAEARNALGQIILATGFFPSAYKSNDKVVRDIQEFLAGRSDREVQIDPVKLSGGVVEKVGFLARELDETEYGHGLADKIADYILTRPEVDCVTIRPRRLAKLWEVPERLAIEACLQAAKLGLLGSRWDLLCPRCQVGKAPVENLADLPEGAHCSTCNIDFERDFTKNLELAFYPSRTLRPIESGEYCLMGPMATPHIRIQLTVGPGEERIEPAKLEFGYYRVRTLERGGEAAVEWAEGGFPEVIADGADVSAGAAVDPGTIKFVNRLDRSLTFIIEEYAWRRDVLTAHRATTMQAFRQLFDQEILRPGDNVEIDNITIMFTDLKGSTAMYERLGDSQAYYLVRQFFAVLGGAIRENNGTVVKTIGDAVNAAFYDPADALRCAVQIQQDVEQFNAGSGKEPITVTLGIHTGRCISVTLNGRLDYYGTAANLAARLEGQSDGGDAVLSPAFCADPRVSELLKEFSLETGAAELKGFDEPVDFYRIPAANLSGQTD